LFGWGDSRVKRVPWRCCFDDGRSRGDQLPPSRNVCVVCRWRGAEGRKAAGDAGGGQGGAVREAAWCVVRGVGAGGLQSHGARGRAALGLRAPSGSGSFVRWVQLGAVPSEEEVLPGLWSVPVARLAGTGRGRGGPHVSLSVRARGVLCVLGSQRNQGRASEGGMAAAAVHMSYRPCPSDRRGRLIG